MKLTYQSYKKYNQDGYFVYKDLLTRKNCEKIRKIILNSKNHKVIEFDKDHPFSNIPNKPKVLLLQNIMDQKKLNNLIDLKKILTIGSFFSKKKQSHWFQKIYLKNAFDGDNEVYHQDFSYHENKGLENKNYIQCFVALHDHTTNGGCLRIFKGSHKLGLLKHNVIMTRNGLNKITISADKLMKITKQKKLVNLELSAGSCVFFSYLTIHGSSSNASEINQPRMIFQMKTENKNFKINKVYKISKTRANIDQKILNKMILLHDKKIKYGKFTAK